MRTADHAWGHVFKVVRKGTPNRPDPGVSTADDIGHEAGYGHDRAAYAAIMVDYVADWSGVLDQVTVPVTIWHGNKDNWVPVQMAQTLCDHLPDAALNRVPNLGHFGALHHVAANTPALDTT